MLNPAAAAEKNSRPGYKTTPAFAWEASRRGYDQVGRGHNWFAWFHWFISLTRRVTNGAKLKAILN
jgi:hypothetical protein